MNGRQRVVSPVHLAGRPPSARPGRCDRSHTRPILRKPLSNTQLPANPYQWTAGRQRNKAVPIYNLFRSRAGVGDPAGPRRAKCGNTAETERRMAARLTTTVDPILMFPIATTCRRMRRRRRLAGRRPARRRASRAVVTDGDMRWSRPRLSGLYEPALSVSECAPGDRAEYRCHRYELECQLKSGADCGDRNGGGRGPALRTRAFDGATVSQPSWCILYAFCHSWVQQS
jgi:hypothetical protein